MGPGNPHGHYLRRNAFKDIQSAVHGISDKVLTDRLRQMLDVPLGGIDEVGGWFESVHILQANSRLPGSSLYAASRLSLTDISSKLLIQFHLAGKYKDTKK